MESELESKESYFVVLLGLHGWSLYTKRSRLRSLAAWLGYLAEGCKQFAETMTFGHDKLDRQVSARARRQLPRVTLVSKLAPKCSTLHVPDLSSLAKCSFPISFQISDMFHVVKVIILVGPGLTSSGLDASGLVGSGLDGSGLVGPV